MAFDLSNLLQPVSVEQPCGENLEYDADFLAMDGASHGKPEQQYGNTIVPPVPPDWREVVRVGTSLLKRTKDLRVVCLVTHAMLETDGLVDFSLGLQLVRNFVEHHWEDVHPRLDPEDDNDPTWRPLIRSLR